MRAFVDGIEVPITPDKAPAFSFQLFNHLEPGTGRGSSTSPIKFPATAEVQEIFGSHQTSEAPDADTHRLVIMEGSAVIYEAEVIAREWSRDYIEVVCVGDNASWGAALGSTQISEIPLDKFGPVDSAGQRASWKYDNPVVFPLIDYGLFQDRDTTYDVQVGSVWPGVRVHHILDRAFSRIGYSLKFEGRALDKYNKLIIPFSGKAVDVAPEQLVANYCTATLSGPGTPPTPTPLAIPPYLTPILVDTVVNDPSGLFDGADYLPALSGSVDIDATFQVVYYHAPGYPTPTTIHIPVYAYQNVPRGVQHFFFTVTNPGPWTFNIVAQFRNLPMVATLPYRVYVGHPKQYNAPPDQMDLMSAEITWRPSRFDWQEGVEFYPSTTLPKMTCAELFKAIRQALNLVVSTDDLSKSVIVRHMDEHFLPTTEGDDWTGIQDHATPSNSERTTSPLKFVFKWKEDNNDKGTDEWVNNERPYGGETFDMGKPRSGTTEVAPAFAPTYMGYRFDAGMYIPVMIDKSNEGNTEFKTSLQPRLLYFGGVTAGRWTFDGTTEEEYPKAWFVPMSASDPSLSFGDETQGGPVVPGTVKRHHLEHLSRLKDGRMFTTRVALDDVDIMERDFRKPKLLSDGAGKGWFLMLSIKNYLWGGRRTTEILTMKN